MGVHQDSAGRSEQFVAFMGSHFAKEQALVVSLSDVMLAFDFDTLIFNSISVL
jgi:hypothetical protein